MLVEDKIFEMYIQINEPCAKKKNSLKQSTPLKNASTSVHILEGMGSFKIWKKLIYQLETCEGSPSKLEKAVLLSYRSCSLHHKYLIYLTMD